MEMTHFKTEDEFWKAYEQFNYLYDGMPFEWKQMDARKEHIGIFNVRIKPRETYFRKDLGGFSYESAELLSMSSMEKLVYVVIGINSGLGAHLQNKLDQQWKDMVDRLG